MRTIKCLAVGDGAVGKTCMLISYVNNKLLYDYVPTVFDNYSVTVTIANKNYQLDLFDTAGQEDYDRLRTLSYPRTDIFLVCFSVVNVDSYKNISSKWVPEIRQHCPKAPLLIVGTQVDLRNNRRQDVKVISPEKGRRLAKELGAVGYVECSALTQIGLKEVFDQAIITAVLPGPLKNKNKFIMTIKFKNKKCSIL